MISANASPPPQPKEMAVLLIHDARAVRDTADVYLKDFLAEGKPAWIVAKVSPGPRAGTAEVPGAYVKSETGQFINPDNATAVAIKEGTWKALAAAEGSGPPNGNYAWRESLAEEKRSLAPEDYYSPFTAGGTILFKPAPGAPGAEQFSGVRLLFTDWGKDVGPAFEFMAQHPALLDSPSELPADPSALTPLVAGDNRLLAALAFRRLARSGQVTSQFAHEILGRNKGELLALLVYLVLADPGPEADKNQLAQEVVGAVEASNEVAKLRFIALGAFAAGLFDAQNSATLQASKRVLKSLRSRLNQFPPDDVKGSYWTSIFEKMGVSP